MTMPHVTANLWHNRGTKCGEARSIGCLTTQKSGEARASVPQWFRRLWHVFMHWIEMDNGSVVRLSRSASKCRISYRISSTLCARNEMLRMVADVSPSQ